MRNPFRYFYSSPEVIGLAVMMFTLARRPINVVLVAMANKTARVVWAMLNRGETFRTEARVAA